MIKKSELKLYEEIVNKVTKDNKNEIEETMNEYFHRLKDLVIEAEEKAQEKFNSISKQQETIVKNYTVV